VARAPRGKRGILAKVREERQRGRDRQKDRQRYKRQIRETETAKKENHTSRFLTLFLRAIYLQNMKKVRVEQPRISGAELKGKT
jgi:hypothetical protein